MSSKNPPPDRCATCDARGRNRAWHVSVASFAACQRCHNALAGASIHLCVPAVDPGQPNVGILDFGVWIADFGFWILVVLLVLVAAPNAAVWISGVGFWISYTGLDFAED